MPMYEWSKSQTNQFSKLYEAFERGDFDEEYKESEEQEHLRGPHAFYIWLGEMRLVCKLFDDIITPLVYETVNLSSELVIQRLLESPVRFGVTVSRPSAILHSIAH